MSLPASPGGGTGEFKRFLWLVIVMFCVILAGLAIFMWLSGDPGSLPFQYDGMN